MSKSILLVDDDQDIRELLQAYLSKCGFQVQAVADGQGFRQALDASDCDLVILDVMLPTKTVSVCAAGCVSTRVRRRCRSSCSPPVPTKPTG